MKERPSIMVNPFICGGGAFHRQDEEEDDPFSPKKSSNFRSKYSSNNKNPYSDRGLDKFSALLAELEDKRKKIYTQMGSDEISFVRFVYSNCDDIKPIVVRVRDRKKLQKNKSDVSDVKIHHNNKIKPMSHNSSEPLISPNEVCRRKGNELVQRCCCLIILILAFLALFGRSFAVLCTSLWWFLLPAIKRGNSNEKRVIKKLVGRRRIREKKIDSVGLPSPAGEMTGMTPRRQLGHRKSW